MRRHILSVRKITHAGQEDNRDLKIIRQLVQSHLNETHELLKNYNPETVFNMNETPVYIDMVNDRTISFMGGKKLRK